jgi:hypothetical protein
MPGYQESYKPVPGKKLSGLIGMMLQQLPAL